MQDWPIISSSTIAVCLLFLPSLLVCRLVSVLILRKAGVLKHAAVVPPAPVPLPIVGHLHLLGDLPHQSLYRMSRTYGPLMLLRLGSVPTLIASSPDMAREILQRVDLAFASRPRIAAGIYTAYDGSDVAFAPYGSHWRLVRKICVTDLLSAKRLEALKMVRVQEVARLVRSVWEDSVSGRNVHVIFKLSSHANNVVSRMALGKSYSDLSGGDMKNMIELLDELFYLNGQFIIGDFLSCLQTMDLQGYIRRMKRVSKQLDEIFQRIVDNRRRVAGKQEQGGAPKDMLGVLLADVEETAEAELKITDVAIKGILLDMFAAGTDTSAVTSEWALAEVMRNPDIMKKLQAEIDAVVGHDRRMEESDIAQLPFLRAVVKETMRLHPASPLLLPHESTKPCRVAGFEVAEKTRALVNVWAIGRDESAWERPLEFWPERFMEGGSSSGVDVAGMHFELLPFGAGRRGCPGWSLGLLNVQMAVGSLVQGFQWELPQKGPLDMSEKFGGTAVKASPLVAAASARLPARLYPVA